MGNLLSTELADIQVRGLGNIHSPPVQELREWVMTDAERKQSFETGIRTAQACHTSELDNIQCLEDYFCFLEEQLHWIPTEANRPRDLLIRLCKIWFILSQPSIARYQSPIHPAPAITPSTSSDPKLTWLSAWMVRYNAHIGLFMDTPASATCIDTFRTNPSYHIDDYIEPRGGWRSFNDFFCRMPKPGRRPIAAIADESVLTSPADCQFKEMHPISPDSTVTTKGLTWQIAQMLVDSPYKDAFENGTWMHAFLNVDDYHRIHTPVSGVVREARIIAGQNYMDVRAVWGPDLDSDAADGKATHAALEVGNETGYQFCQARGLVVLDTGHGLVAVLPVGMAMVSSVILTAEVGAGLRKGEEIGYFQFGGSDVVLMFAESLKAEITMVPDQHYNMGVEIGRVRGT